MVISMKKQMDQLIRQAASIINTHKGDIQKEWDYVFYRINQNQQLIDSEPNGREQLKLIPELFWKHLPSICTNDADPVFRQLQAEWSNHNEHPFNSQKLILIFTMLENAIHKVIGKNNTFEFHVHQSIQHLFSLTVQSFLSKTKTEMINVDYFVSHLFQQKENHFLWAAKIVSDEIGFRIVSFTSHQKLIIDDTWKNMIMTLQGPSLTLLSDAILRLLNCSTPVNELEVFPLTAGTDTYLFCIHKSDGEHIKPFFSLSLQLLQQNEDVFQNMQMTNEWKDSLILFDEWIMLARNFEEAVDKVVNGFVNYLPFKRAALFYYTETENGEEIGIGVMGHKINTNDIRRINENLNNLPTIKKKMTHVQPIYVSNAEVILPEKFVKQFELKSLVLAPIYSASNNQIWGGVFLDQGEGNTFEVSDSVLSVITKFGQHAGEILSKYSSNLEKTWSSPKKTSLKDREIEILRLLADGKTIDEAADLLFLSKYTVRDYISETMKKLDAQNRAHAIAMAIRQGLI
ncbi:response regulator transcription factor [Bacillus sp. V59.32b]|uniref:response regulator transcription factor n=1 Tax=Bacillus sp. V59.32b TaxID=1758642 RepID=UPI000E3DA592|nr:LuxR C-terminal-related transcriptional regulator [Bacillus sp. V59.32b]RFU61689.1 DNA-binding response regulator [Bacillus sp. V59.32b]